MSKRKQTYPRINAIECKACKRCVFACGLGLLSLSDKLNSRGFTPVVYAGNGCTGCGNCFYACPEFNVIDICCEEE